MPTRRTMRLDELVGAPAGAAAGHAAGDADGFPPPVEIGSLAYDSSRVQPGALFFCVPGLRHDGHDFAPDALARGAVALVVEHPLGLGVPEIVVPSARGAMGPMAARFYGEPSAALSLIGVTGTNGKTTTAFMVRKLLECAGERCGLLGTVKSVIGGTERPAGRTTPDAIDLQGDLRAMLDGGDGACAMEVSSHALALGRTSALRFAVAIFTNLTQDHLDFHRDMEEYFQAKRALFVPGRDGALDGVGRQAAGAPAAGARIGGPPAAVPADTRPVAPSHSVINVGDPYGRRLAAELSGAITFAVLADGREDEEDGDAALASADYRALDVRCDAAGSHFTLVHPEGRCEVTMAMPGRFNVANALGAIAAARALGVALAPMLERLERPIAVPGRFERVDEGQAFAVLVDYAHTPDSLARVLESARELTGGAGHAGGAGGRVLCVFGAGGDRDRGKRPLMGSAAAGGADLLVITSDNPRSEDPGAIVAEVASGLTGDAGSEHAPEAHIVLDRREAIARAFQLAGGGDVVVIAGKGHEQGQELANGTVVPFDDVLVAREELRRLAAAAAPSGAGVAGGAEVGA